MVKSAVGRGSVNPDVLMDKKPFPTYASCDEKTMEKHRNHHGPAVDASCCRAYLRVRKQLGRTSAETLGLP